MIIGSGLGILCKCVLCGEISQIFFAILWGAVIGTMLGALGGAFHRWLRSRRTA